MINKQYTKIKIASLFSKTILKMINKDRINLTI